MPTGVFVPVAVTSADGKNTWKGRGRKPAWLKAEEAAKATKAATVAQPAVAESK